MSARVVGSGRSSARVRASRLHGVVVLALALGALAGTARPAAALRFVTWNLTNYSDGPPSTFGTRQGYFQTVMGAIQPDVFIAQELKTSVAADSFRINVLQAALPGRVWKSTWVSASPSTESAVFWDSLKVTASGFTALNDGGPRSVLACLIKPLGYVSATAGTRLYSIHLKAGGPGTADSTTRRLEATSIRNSLNLAPTGTNILLGGDSNIYGAYEGAYQRFTESQVDNDGRLFDPYTMPGDWHSIAGYAIYDTQCPCLTGCNTTLGFSGGGLDDRFDIFLSTAPMNDGQGLDVVPGLAGTFAFGNDGAHFNQDVNGGPNGVVSATVANALHEASDHLPVVAIVQIPSRLADSTVSIAFGRVLVAASVLRQLVIRDGAPAPADGLDYTIGAAPAGFTAPSGSFSVAAGAPPNRHDIGMDTSAPGSRVGSLPLTTDDPDSASRTVPLSGTVLRHAVASLDSASTLTALTLDFGSQPVDAFRDTTVRVHDAGWDALQASLAVGGATLVGGDGRFSLVGGFTPLEIAGVGHTWSVHFDANGASLDSSTTATLTFTSADEPLPGAASQPDLVVHLAAHPMPGTGAVPPGGPSVLGFEAPRPNPSSGTTWFGFDLPAAQSVRLTVYDLSGRRVATLVSGTLESGHHMARWDGTLERGGRAPAGLYFARFETPGMRRVARLALLP
jgi:hypothetical protein